MNDVNRSEFVSSILQEVLQDYGFTMQAVKQLQRRSRRSVEEACQRLASHTPAEGAFIILDRDGSVVESIRLLIFYPAKQGSDQSEMTIYRQACRNWKPDVLLSRDDVQIRYSNGSYSDKLYAQAMVFGDKLVILALAANAPWVRDAPEQRGTGVYMRGTLWPFTCKTCKHHYNDEGSICSECGRRKCPKGHCQCPPGNPHVCPECFLERSANEFRAGSEICKECEGIA